MLDAAIQTVNALHKQNPLDFGISLGDAINITQYNETSLYIDVIDGKVITPQSGAHLELKPLIIRNLTRRRGSTNRSPGIKPGNHDHFGWVPFPVDYSLRKDLRQSYVADEVFATGDVLRDPREINNRDYYVGVFDGSTPYGNIKYAGPVKDFKTPPKVAADPDRRSLLRTEWMQEFFNTSTLPIGHGFNLTDVENGFACYSFVPKIEHSAKVIRSGQYPAGRQRLCRYSWARLS